MKAKNIGQTNALRIIKDKPTGSYFLGGYYQRGKTHLLVAQYRWMLDRKMRCILVTAQDLMEDLRKTEMTPNDGQPPYESPILRMVEHPDGGHLFIDDIDKAPVRSGFRAEALFALLDQIKRRQLGLSVTSNLPLTSEEESVETIESKLTSQAVSRIHQICKVIAI
jgi:DNA replication protein DnaC